MNAVSELERRRLAARAHDQQQRQSVADQQAHDDSVRKKVDAERQRIDARRSLTDSPSLEDRLAALLVKDDRALCTVGDLRAIFQHLEARFDFFMDETA